MASEKRAGPGSAAPRVFAVVIGRLMILSLVFSLACLKPVPPSPAVFSPDLPWKHDAKDSNWYRLHHSMAGEGEYYTGRLDGRPGPGLCMALSGGGMRSAAFSIGVMSGLNETHLLEKVDVASAVSGGGYALSWYMVQHADALAAMERANKLAPPEELEEEWRYDPRPLDKKLFDPAGAYQGNLERDYDLFKVSLRNAAGRAESFWSSLPQLLRSLRYGATAIALTMPSIPVHLFFNGVFGWRVNTAPVRLLYENSIERVFHSNPDRSNLWSGLSINARGRKEAVEFDDLRKLLDATKSEGHHLPFPVFGVNLDFDVSTDAHAVELANRMYEFTPLRAGADSVGWTSDHPVDVARAVAISGAAMDTQALLVGAQAILASTANVNLGYSIPNPLTRGAAAVNPAQNWYWLSPIPLYLLAGGRSSKGLAGISLHLTDGGHIENLAVFTAARRLCEHIIIVDGTGDPEFAFGDYKKVQASMASEMGMALSVPGIDEWLKTRRGVEVLADEVALRQRYREQLAAWNTSMKKKGKLIRGRVSQPKKKPLLEEPSWEGANPQRANQVRIALEHLEPLLDPKLQGCLEGREGKLTKTPELRAALSCQLERFHNTGEEVAMKKAHRWLSDGNLFDGRAPIMLGKVEVPRAGRLAEEKMSMGVTYLKLSLYRYDCFDDARDRKTADGSAPGYNSETTCKFAKRDESFPQVSTGEVSYSVLQYRATRDLGRDIVCWGAKQRKLGSAFDAYGAGTCGS